MSGSHALAEGIRRGREEGKTRGVAEGYQYDRRSDIRLSRDEREYPSLRNRNGMEGGKKGKHLRSLRFGQGSPDDAQHSSPSSSASSFIGSEKQPTDNALIIDS